MFDAIVIHFHLGSVSKKKITTKKMLMRLNIIYYCLNFKKLSFFFSAHLKCKICLPSERAQKAFVFSEFLFLIPEIHGESARRIAGKLEKTQN